MKDGISIISYALSYSSDKNLPVYLLGRSLGGAVSIYLASNNLFKHKIRGLIL
jgi:alpha-beta hydrolase superfamily lysophospholipase